VPPIGRGVHFQKWYVHDVGITVDQGTHEDSRPSYGFLFATEEPWARCELLRAEPFPIIDNPVED
jgi:hypothetical protein